TSNLARCATATASSAWSSSYDARQANDGSGSTRWNSATGDTAGAWLAMAWSAATTFNTIVLQEPFSRITGYRLQYWNGTAWTDIASGTSIGSSKTHSFASVTATQVRLYVTSTVSSGSTGTPTISELEVYRR